jgi:hypothetical protein
MPTLAGSVTGSPLEVQQTTQPGCFGALLPSERLHGGSVGPDTEAGRIGEASAGRLSHVGRELVSAVPQSAEQPATAPMRRRRISPVLLACSLPEVHERQFFVVLDEHMEG